MVVLVLQWHEKLCPLVIYRQIFRGKSPMGAVFRVHQLLNRRVYCLGGGGGGLWSLGAAARGAGGASLLAASIFGAWAYCFVNLFYKMCDD